jgi:hypothetical protein
MIGGLLAASPDPPLSQFSLAVKTTEKIANESWPARVHGTVAWRAELASHKPSKEEANGYDSRCSTRLLAVITTSPESKYFSWLQAMEGYFSESVSKVMKHERFDARAA